MYISRQITTNSVLTEEKHILVIQCMLILTAWSTYIAHDGSL